MNYDEWGEIINGENTYKFIAGELGSNALMVGWTDGNGTHFDVLFTLTALFYGTNIQGGLRKNDLFVSIMRRGAFGFEIEHTDTHSGYYDEKLGGGMGSTSEALAELINGVKKHL